MSDILKKKLIHSLIIPSVFIIILWLVFGLENLGGYSFKEFGVYPRCLKGLFGIFCMPFIHADLSHLIANSSSLFLLSWLLFMKYSNIAFKVFLSTFILSSILLWLIGQPVWHIGASGVVYALAFFLFVSGVYRKESSVMAIALIVVFLYGSMLWYMIPQVSVLKISWDGHLSGAVVGFFISIIFRNINNNIGDKNENSDQETEFMVDWRADIK